MTQVMIQAQEAQPMFAAFSALALSLAPDLSGICLLDGALHCLGEHGDLKGGAVAEWLRSLGYPDAEDRLPVAKSRGRSRWCVAIPLVQSDGTLLGLFCVCQSQASAPAQPAVYAAQLKQLLKPLLDCVHRDLVAARPTSHPAQDMTERSAELEWLFKVTSNLKGAVDDRRIVEELLKAATERLGSVLGVLCVPDKRLTVRHAADPAAAAALITAWTESQQQLITWAQRQKRPLVVNRVGRGDSNRVRCKLLSVPIVRESGRVVGAITFLNPQTAPDYVSRQTYLARHIGRQAAMLVEAQFDLMTGLYTRAGLDQMFSAAEEDVGYGEQSILYLDIDHMHVANELHGFELGNELIVRVADLLAAPLLPENALAARISGDRFAVVLPQTSCATAAHIAEKLQNSASQLVIGPTKDGFDVSISCGVCVLLPMPDGLARAIAGAELACKTGKQRGRNRVEMYAFEDGSMMRRHSDALAVGQLRSALKADRLQLYAQRISPLQDRSLPGGYELLLRLRDVDGNLIPPGPLIEAAQRYQILPSIDRWVSQRALQMLAPYRSMLKSREIGMSINISGQSMGDEVFISQFSQLLKDANLPKHSVSLELTEQAALTNLARATQMVARISNLGCRFALDDFGTGANSLSYLKSLQIYRVKIDGSFVRDILTNRNSQATVRAIVELAKGFGIETVAEYVENEAIANAVRTIGVDYAQGFAFGKPEPLDALLARLSRDESQRLRKVFLQS